MLKNTCFIVTKIWDIFKACLYAKADIRWEEWKIKNPIEIYIIKSESHQ